MSKNAAQILVEKKRIKDRERRFWEAPQAGRRVLIAKDVLMYLAAKKIKAVHGHWFDVKAKNDGDQDQVRDVLIANNKPCSACALGAMFYSAVMRADDLTVNDVGGGGSLSGLRLFLGDFHAYMRKFFSEEQLQLIEAAFEVGQGEYGYRYLSTPPTTPIYDAILFGQQFKPGKERMTAIMRNIIANKGTFKPPAAPLP